MMTHSSIHFAAGMIAAMAVHLPCIIKKIKRQEPLFATLFSQFISSVLLGAIASAPALIARLGVPSGFFDHPIANFFFFYPIINSLFGRGGTYTGPAAIVLMFFVQYTTVLFALHAAGRRKKLYNQDGKQEQQKVNT